MSSLNEANIIGNVGKDPEIRTTQTGQRIATLSVATSEQWKDKNSGEKKEATEWHRVVIFNEGLVGVVERFVSKGTKLFVRGKLQTRKWTDNNNVERYTTEIVIQQFGGQLVLLGGTKTREAGDAPAGGPPPKDLDDEIPF